MASFLEREQLLPIAPSIAPADQILGAFNTKQSLFGIGAAQLKSAYNGYSQMQLTNPQNQMQLDGLLKQAGTDLKAASVTDLSVGDNQSKALGVFDPINKDQDILGDNAITTSWNRSKSQAESARVSNGGKGFNQASLDAVNYQQALYAKADKSTWKTFYNNKESYNPYYDVQGEMGKLTKLFKTDVIEKDSQNGAYITTTKDSSWYKDKWQQFFEANASPQLKAQVGQASRAEYYRDMLTMPRELIVQKYTDLRNGLIRKQMGVDASNMMNIGAQLAIKHSSKDNDSHRAALIAQANYLNDAYNSKKQVLNSSLEGADAVGTIDGIGVATRMAEGLGQYKYFDKIGDAFAHKEEKFSIKPDYAYLSLKRLSEQAKEFGIRQSETGRHNRAMETHATNMETIDMIKAQADLIRANKTGKGKNGNDAEDFTNMTENGGTGGLQNSNKLALNSDSEQAQVQGNTVLDHLGNVKKQYDEVFDNTTDAIFGKNIMSQIDNLAKDPNSQKISLAQVPDASAGPDGSGGTRSRLIKFMVASGALNADKADLFGAITGQPYSPEEAASSLTVGEVRNTIRQIFADPAMLKMGIEGIKGNDPSISAYAVAAEIEMKKQRIDGTHATIVNNAIPILRTNLEGSAKLFENEYFSKGKIPTREEVRKTLEGVPINALKDETHPSLWARIKDAPVSTLYGIPQLPNQDDNLIRETATDNIMHKILGTLGANRTAYNPKYEELFPNKGNADRDTEYETRVIHLIEGAEGQTKGLGSGVLYALKYAKEHPEDISHVQLNAVDEAHNIPYMQIYFNKGKGKDIMPESGVEIPTTNAARKFYDVPANDRSTLLNNSSLSFQAKYNDGTKSNLSIYNSTGDKSTPQFDINPDFSYNTLDIDPTNGDIKGVRTIYKSEEINNLTRGNPNMFPLAINTDPTEIYTTLSKKMLKSRDAVNAYLDSKGTIKNINDLPEYIKNALKTQF